MRGSNETIQLACQPCARLQVHKFAEAADGAAGVTGVRTAAGATGVAAEEAGLLASAFFCFLGLC